MRFSSCALALLLLATVTLASSEYNTKHSNKYHSNNKYNNNNQYQAAPHDDGYGRKKHEYKESREFPRLSYVLSLVPAPFCQDQEGSRAFPLRSKRFPRISCVFRGSRAFLSCSGGFPVLSVVFRRVPATFCSAEQHKGELQGLKGQSKRIGSDSSWVACLGARKTSVVTILDMRTNLVQRVFLLSVPRSLSVSLFLSVCLCACLSVSVSLVRFHTYTCTHTHTHTHTHTQTHTQTHNTTRTFITRTHVEKSRFFHTCSGSSFPCVSPRCRELLPVRVEPWQEGLQNHHILRRGEGLRPLLLRKQQVPDEASEEDQAGAPGHRAHSRVSDESVMPG